MGAGESVLHDPFSLNMESSDDEDEHIHSVSFPQNYQPPATLPLSLSAPFSLSTSSQAISTASRNEAQLSNLTETERSNVGATLSLLLSRTSGAFSSGSAHPFNWNVSPLLLSSDAGLSGVLEVLFGSHHRGSSLTTDPVLDITQHTGQSGRSRIRPRVLGAASVTKTDEKENTSRHRASKFPASPRSPNSSRHSNEEVLTQIIDEFKCPICLDVFDRPVATPCRHVFCVECMVTSLVRQSICPLCRSAVYVHLLRPLADIVTDPALKHVYKKYLELVIECPKCDWLGTMASWGTHIDSLECRTGRDRRRLNAQQSSLTGSSKTSLGSSQNQNGISQIGELSSGHFITSVNSLPKKKSSGEAGTRRLRRRRASGDIEAVEELESAKLNRLITCRGKRDRGKEAHKEFNDSVNEQNFAEESARERRIGRFPKISRKKQLHEEDTEKQRGNGKTVRQIQDQTRSRTSGANETSMSSSSTRPTTSEDIEVPSHGTRGSNPQSDYHAAFGNCSAYLVKSNTLSIPVRELTSHFGPHQDTSSLVPYQSSEIESTDVDSIVEDSSPIQHNVSLPTFYAESSTDRLACWLLDHDPGVVTRLYVVSHRMENTMGAIGGLVFTGVTHTQAILEFESYRLFKRRQANLDREMTETDHIDEETQNKIFVGMEIFADRIGTEWQVHEIFPPLKSTAHSIAVYDNLNVQKSVVVEFLLSCRHRKYSLLNWNCQIFISDLRRSAGITDTPTSIRLIPRPTSHSEDLMQLLEKIDTNGDLPLLASRQVDETSLYRRLPLNSDDTPTTLANPILSNISSARSWTSNLNPFRMMRRSNSSNLSAAISPNVSTSSENSHRSLFRKKNPRSNLSSPSPVAISSPEINIIPSFPKTYISPSPPVVRIGSVTMCLFPAEDRHRMGLRPAAQFSAFWARTFGLVRPSVAAVPLAVGKAQSLPNANSDDISLVDSRRQLETIQSTTETNGDAVMLDREIVFPQSTVGVALSGSTVSATQNVETTKQRDSKSFESGVYRDVDHDPYLNTEKSALEDSQIKLRYLTFPVLIFHIQALRILQNSNDQSSYTSPSPEQSSSSKTAEEKLHKNWETLAFLSLEFRSDCGLFWHLYHEPVTQKGGTDFVFSSQTSFPLAVLRECLFNIKDNEYHPTRWSGWEFAQAILNSCCPSVAHHFLVLPVADALVRRATSS